MNDAARELRRQAYLQALGMDQYVSRRPLPGASPTRRWCINASPRPVSAPDEPARHEQAASTVAGPPTIEITRRPPAVAKPPESPRQAGAVERFRVAAVQAGGWLWLEDLGDMPLAQEQLQLVVAMATAMTGSAVKPVVAQFDWPMHNNQQLDLGPDAAMTSLGSFIERQLADSNSTGVVLLGAAAGRRLPSRLSCPHRLEIPGTREMLENPRLKRQAWACLMPHARE